MTTEAEAIRVAYEILKSKGWKFDATDVGIQARKILKEIEDTLWD